VARNAKSIEDYLRKRDLCQKQKADGELITALGEVDEAKVPVEVTSINITGPYPLTPRGNRYFLTFIDHFSKYVEAFAIQDQTAEKYARVYVTQIIT
jgi:hypothetical protein